MAVLFDVYYYTPGAATMVVRKNSSFGPCIITVIISCYQTIFCYRIIIAFYLNMASEVTKLANFHHVQMGEQWALNVWYGKQ